MTAKFWNGSAYVDLTTYKMWNGSAWVTLTTGKMWDGTSWINVLPGGGGGGGGSLTVTANTGLLTGSVHATGPYPLFQTVYTSGFATVTATNGTGPYTYEWVHESGDSAVQVVSPDSATTQFFGNVGRDQQITGTKRCVVIDSLGATGYVDVDGDLLYTTDL